MSTPQHWQLLLMGFLLGAISTAIPAFGSKPPLWFAVAYCSLMIVLQILVLFADRLPFRKKRYEP